MCTARTLMQRSMRTAVGSRPLSFPGTRAEALEVAIEVELFGGSSFLINYQTGGVTDYIHGTGAGEVGLEHARPVCK